MKRFLGLLGLLALAGCAHPHVVKAQFIGYTSPQTVQQTLATSMACNGGPQTYVVNNLGQTEHYVSLITGGSPQKLSAVIQGFDNVGDVLPISDVLELAGSGQIGGLFGSGYYPKIAVTVTCSPNTATYTLSYSGVWATAYLSAGNYLTAQIDKVALGGSPANATQTNTFQTPFGASSGTLYAFYNTAGNAGGTLAVLCQGVVVANQTIATSQTLTNTTALQKFLVPAQACPFATVQFTPAGGFAGTVTVEYIFSQPGIIFTQ